MPIDTGIRAEGDLHALTMRDHDGLAELREPQLRFRFDLRCVEARTDAFTIGLAGGQRRHEPCAAFLHRAHRGFVTEAGMLDRIKSRPRGRFDAARAMRMCRSAQAEQLRRLDDRGEFAVREMAVEAARLQRQHAAGDGDLDDVGAVVRQLAHGTRAIIGAAAGVACTRG